MRALAVILVVVTVTGCQLGEPGVRVSNDHFGRGEGAAECEVDLDCALAAATCCACPTFAVAISDAAHRACDGVSCPPATCAANVRARCDRGACTVAWVALACTVSCADGYATDATGCLSCACAAATADGCAVDADCARVRADCCGCARGGHDTAVPRARAATHDAALACAPEPQCPGVETCTPDVAPRCAHGRCELAAGAVAPLPNNACGRPDLPGCPASQTCTVNADPAATAAGVGVCLPR